MVSLLKTRKFKVLSLPGDSMVMSSDNVPSRRSSSVVVVGGGRKVLVSDVAKIAVLGYAVSLDISSIEKIDAELASSTDIMQTFIPGCLSNNGESAYAVSLCRAAVFARIVSLMQGRTGVRSEVIEFLVDMLGADVVPNFSSPELAGSDLCAVVTGTGGSCYGNGTIMPSAAALSLNGLAPIELTAAEASTLKLGQFFATGCACLVASGAANIMLTIDSVAALSCDSFGANVEPFDSTHFDTHRQHRGQISSATNLRLLLEGSKRVNSPAMLTSPLASAFSSIPQVNGPAQDYFFSSVKVLEIELNSSETGPLLDNKSGLNPAQSLIALRSISACVGVLFSSSKRRLLSLQQMSIKQIVERDSSDCYSDVREALALSLPLESSDEFKVSYFLLNSLSSSLAAELNTCATYLTALEGPIQSTEEGDSEVRVKGGKESAMKPETDESGMTPEQRAKAEAKRKQKADKAAQKNAAKEAKKGADSGVKVQTLALGQGSTAIRQAVMIRARRGSKAMSEEAFAGIVDPFDVTEEGFGSFCVKLLEDLRQGGKRRPKIPKGTRDFAPEQMRIREQVFAAIRRIFKRHGGVEIDTPVFELKEVLTGKYGEDSKLIYDLADQGGELLCLRYDLTVPFARFLAMNSVGNIKRYHIAKVYRRDQPQLNKGRYREFYQCDFDVAGSFSPMVPDAEVITVAAEILSELPVGKFLIKLNHRKLLDAIFEICGVPAEKFRPICSAVDKLDKAPWEEVRTEMIVDKGLASDVADRIGTFVLQFGKPKDLWALLSEKKIFGDHQGAGQAMADLHALFEYLQAMGSLPYVSFDLSLARGLDYYTGVIYEVVLVDGTSQVGSIAAGGRYDNLVGMFSASGTQTPCVGVSIGIERVFTIIEKKAEELKLAQASPIQVFIASIGSNLIAERMKVAKLLWAANIPAEYSHQDNPKFKKQLEETLERGIPFMAVFGEDEMVKGVIKLKNMREHTESEIAVDDLVKELLTQKVGVIPAGTDLGFLTALRNTY